MNYSLLSQQLPQEDTKGIDVHSWCDRVWLGLLRGVVALASSTQQLWGRVARVANLQSQEAWRKSQRWTHDNGDLYDRAGVEQLSGCIIQAGIATSSLQS